MMPKRLWTYSRSEPARTILFMISLVFLLSQVFTLSPWYVHPDISGIGGIDGSRPPFGEKAPNAVFFGAVSGYGVWSTAKNNTKHMSWSSMAMFALFLLAALTRALFAPNPANLLWLAYFGLSVVMGIIHIYMEGLRKGGVHA